MLTGLHCVCVGSTEDPGERDNGGSAAHTGGLRSAVQRPSHRKGKLWIRAQGEGNKQMSSRSLFYNGTSGPVQLHPTTHKQFSHILLLLYYMYTTVLDCMELLRHLAFKKRTMDTGVSNPELLAGSQTALHRSREPTPLLTTDCWSRTRCLWAILRSLPLKPNVF